MVAIHKTKLPWLEIVVAVLVLIAAYPALVMVIESKIEKEMQIERQYMLEFLAKLAESKPAAVEKAIETAAANDLPELD